MQAGNQVSPWGAELAQLSRWLKEAPRVALATVVSTWGSSPRAVGSHMVIRADQGFVGSVSGGCIEGEVIRNAQEVIEDGAPRLLGFQIANDRAWEMGLSCGGAVEVLVEAIDGDHPLARALAATPFPAECWRLVSLESGKTALFTGAADPALIKEMADPLPEEEGDLAAAVAQAMAGRMSRRLDERHFLHHYQRPPRLVIVGAVHTAQHLAAMALRCGLAPVVVDPRRGFAREERFPDLPLSREWPDRLLEEHPLTPGCALVTLSHDPKIDDPALCAALDSEAFYIGALGSRKTHGERLERLRALGYDKELARICAPVGLDLGGRAPAEIALSVLAQLTRIRYRGADHATL